MFMRSKDSKVADLKSIAKELVIRSRAGDQNASALIMEAAKAAKNGNPRAVKASTEIEKYIDANPLPAPKVSKSSVWSDAMIGYIGELQSNFSGEAVVALVPYIGDFAMTALANGPKLTNDIINQIAAEFGSEKERHAFRFGVVNSKQSDVIKDNARSLPRSIAFAILIGCNVGEAKRVQLVRLPNVPISIVSDRAASELGDL